MSEEKSPPKNWALSFWKHAEELIRRLKVVLIALILSIAIWWLPTSLRGITNPIGGYQPLLSLVMLSVKHVFLPPEATLIAGGMGDTVFAMAYLDIILGILLASPVIFYEVYAFVRPALFDNERKVIVYYVGGFLGLLVLGAAMAYFVIIPITFKILIYFTLQGGAVPFINIKDFYNWIFTLLAITGIFYTIPVFVVMLVQVGVFPMKWLKGRNRLLMYVVIFVVVWIFGPNPDPTGISDAIMMAPFFAVFEVAAFLAKRIDKGRRMKKERESSGSDRVHLGITPVSVCKYCRTPIESNSAFCSNCNRSVV